jgi:hypothetical protein
MTLTSEEKAQVAEVKAWIREQGVKPTRIEKVQYGILVRFHAKTTAGKRLGACEALIAERPFGFIVIQGLTGLTIHKVWREGQ